MSNQGPGVDSTVPGLGSLRVFDLNTVEIPLWMRKRPKRKIKAADKKRDENIEDKHGESGDPDGQQDMFVSLRRIQVMSPHDTKGMWFLNNLLHMVDSYGEKCELCYLVCESLRERNVKMVRLKEHRKLACDKRCVFTKAANETRTSSGLHAELNNNSVLKMIVEQVYFAKIRPRQQGVSGTQTPGGSVGDPSQPPQIHHHRHHRPPPHARRLPVELRRKRRQEKALEAKQAAEAKALQQRLGNVAPSTANAGIRGTDDETSVISSLGSVGSLSQRGSHSRNGLGGKQRIVLPPFNQRYGTGVIDDWLPAPVCLRLNAPTYVKKRVSNTQKHTMDAQIGAPMSPISQPVQHNNAQIHAPVNGSTVKHVHMQVVPETTDAQSSDLAPISIHVHQVEDPVDTKVTKHVKIKSISGSSDDSMAGNHSVKTGASLSRGGTSSSLGFHSSYNSTYNALSASNGSRVTSFTAAEAVAELSELLAPRARQVNVQTQLLLRSMSCPDPQSIILSRSARQRCGYQVPSIYQKGASLSRRSVVGAASEWCAGVDLSSIRTRRDCKPSDHYGRLQEVFRSSLNPPYASRLETEMLVYDTSAVRSGAPGGKATREDIVRAWEQLTDGALARTMLVAVARQAKTVPPPPEANTTDLLPEPLFKALISIECYRPLSPQQLFTEWLGVLMHEVKDHISRLAQRLRGILAVAGAEEFLDRVCADATYNDVYFGDGCTNGVFNLEGY